MFDAAKFHRPYELPIALPKASSASVWAAGPVKKQLSHAISASSVAGQEPPSESPDLLASVQKACDEAVPNSLSGRPGSPSQSVGGKGVLGNVSHVCDVLRREGARGLLRMHAKSVPAAIVAGGVLRYLPPAIGVGGND